MPSAEFSLYILVAIFVFQVLILFRLFFLPDRGSRAAIDGLLQEQGDRIEQALKQQLGESRTETSRLSRELREEVASHVAASGGRLADSLAKQVEALRTSAATSSRDLRSDVNTRLEGFRKSLDDLKEGNARNLGEIRETLTKSVNKLQESNEAKLEAMRKTVDEKLHGALEKRLGESFKQVSERLEAVHTGLGEMQTLATGVGDLKRLMSNVKTRGTWGEMQLGALLESFLSPDQFGANVETKPESGQRVEFAIKLPGQSEDSQPVWLPIDAKFPQEDYQRLLDAEEQSDAVQLDQARKGVERAVRLSAKEIAQKYIHPPRTTDFAILFVPIESLFAELLRRPGLVGALQDDRIILAGPTTLAALLNSLQMGFRTLAIQKRTSEVWEVLGAVKTEFGKFGDVLDKVRKKLNEATNVMDAAEQRSRAMKRKLKSVEAMPDSQAAELLGLEEPDSLAAGV